MSSLQDSYNLSHYDYENGSSDSSGSSDSDSGGFFELHHGENRPLFPVDWNLFTFASVRNAREDRRRRVRKKVYEKEEEREEAEVSTVVGGIDPEAICGSQIGASSLV